MMCAAAENCLVVRVDTNAGELSVDGHAGQDIERRRRVAHRGDNNERRKNETGEVLSDVRGHRRKFALCRAEALGARKDRLNDFYRNAGRKIRRILGVRAKCGRCDQEHDGREAGDVSTSDAEPIPPDRHRFPFSRSQQNARQSTPPAGVPLLRGADVIAIRQLPKGGALHFFHRIAEVTPPFWVGSTRKPGATSRHSRSSPCPGFLLPFLSGAMY
jgi:hypothetical protein